MSCLEIFPALAMDWKFVKGDNKSEDSASLKDGSTVEEVEIKL
jgi:hypothetical protein